jgi:hypothetical protein
MIIQVLVREIYSLTGLNNLIWSYSSPLFIVVWVFGCNEWHTLMLWTLLMMAIDKMRIIGKWMRRWLWLIVNYRNTYIDSEGRTLNQHSLSISRCTSMYEADLVVSVVYFISSSMEYTSFVINLCRNIWLCSSAFRINVSVSVRQNWLFKFSHCELICSNIPKEPTYRSQYISLSQYDIAELVVHI